MGETRQGSKNTIAKGRALKNAITSTTQDINMFKVVGKRLFFAGAIMSFVDVSQNNFSAESVALAALDTIFGAIGTFGGPAGAAIGLIWAVGRLAYDIYKENE